MAPSDRGKGAKKSQKVGTGNYLVTFNRDVSRCVYSATVGDGSNGRIALVEGPANVRQVLVWTYGSSENRIDTRFHLLVNC